MPDAIISPPSSSASSSASSSIHNAAQQLPQWLLPATVGAGACVLLLKGHGSVVRSCRSVLAYCRDPLRHQRVHICNTFEECEAAARQLKAYVVGLLWWSLAN